MDTADPSDAEDAFAALLHRLASPLGAIANYAYLLPAEAAPESRDGILAAMAGVRGTLREAQRWLDALATTRGEVPEGGVDLGAELRAAGERHGLPPCPTPPRPASPTPSWRTRPPVGWPNSAWRTRPARVSTS